MLLLLLLLTLCNESLGDCTGIDIDTGDGEVEGTGRFETTTAGASAGELNLALGISGEQNVCPDVDCVCVDGGNDAPLSTTKGTRSTGTFTDKSNDTGASFEGTAASAEAEETNSTALLGAEVVATVTTDSVFTPNWTSHTTGCRCCNGG